MEIALRAGTQVKLHCHWLASRDKKDKKERKDREDNQTTKTGWLLCTEEEDISRNEKTEHLNETNKKKGLAAYLVASLQIVL